MDAETLAKAVEPFFSTKGVGEGHGSPALLYRAVVLVFECANGIEPLRANGIQPLRFMRTSVTSAASRGDNIRGHAPLRT
jgi:hypothetical protein